MFGRNLGPIQQPSVHEQQDRETMENLEKAAVEADRGRSFSFWVCSLPQQPDAADQEESATVHNSEDEPLEAKQP